MSQVHLQQSVARPQHVVHGAGVGIAPGRPLRLTGRSGTAPRSRRLEMVPCLGRSRHVHGEHVSKGVQHLLNRRVSGADGMAPAGKLHQLSEVRHEIVDMSNIPLDIERCDYTSFAACTRGDTSVWKTT